MFIDYKRRKRRTPSGVLCVGAHNQGSRSRDHGHSTPNGVRKPLFVGEL